MAKKRILLIDDSEFILESTSTLLMFEGYDVITAPEGETGIKLATSENPDLIICDVSMPGLSGYDVVTAIRANPATATTPFIFLTAFTEKSKMREGMEKGANDYLTKPFTKKELVSAIDSQWKRSEKVETQIQSKVETVGKKLNYALPHEFRTVISQILGSITEMKDGAEVLTKEEIIETCDQVITVVNRLNRITDNFLLFTKLENYTNSPEAITELRSGRTDEPFAPFSDVAELVASKYERADDVEILNPTFDIAISMSSDLFHKLTDELIDNAFKFSKKGEKVEIDSKIVDNDGKLEIKITDHGIGMTAEQIKNITAFVQFQREELEQQGVGIGLTIAKKIVELHGGKFSIDSEKEQGTTVTFTIPLKKV
jgi:DNA-binding response OmpR family regulator/anti-sigma regulatory factor (Ser/Thr protein kinase)